MLKITYCFIDNTKLTVTTEAPVEDIDSVRDALTTSLKEQVIEIDDGKGNRWVAPRSSVAFAFVGTNAHGSGKVWS